MISQSAALAVRREPREPGEAPSPGVRLHIRPQAHHGLREKGRAASPPGPRLYAPERLLDADFPHERAKARIWAEGVEQGCRRDEHEPFGALLVGRLQPAQRLLVIPQAQVDKCDGESRVAGRTALERREDVLRFGALAGASGYVPEERRETGRVAGESLRLSSLRQRLGIAPLPGER